ncbi:hypothetical protein ABZ891_13345 [Streptomyces sp. NPDC047023]|uniref:hypothetical protein n=1 Tax=Streptomyces sp. NPDC047023 TaxID=3155139 RepID=UPI0033D11C77
MIDVVEGGLAVPESRIQPSWRAPLAKWIQPAPERAPYAVVPTAYGEYTLFREPGKRPSPAARAEAWERWQLILGEDVVLEIDDAATPWHGLRSRMRAGVHGTLDGMSFTARAASRSFVPDRRGIRFDMSDGRALSFTAHRFHRHFVRGVGGEERFILRSNGARWETDRLDRGELALLCFVLISGADALLTSPLWNL